MLRDLFDWLAAHPTSNTNFNTLIWLGVITAIAIALGSWVGKGR